MLCGGNADFFYSIALCLDSIWYIRVAGMVLDNVTQTTYLDVPKLVLYL